MAELHGLDRQRSCTDWTVGGAAQIGPMAAAARIGPMAEHWIDGGAARIRPMAEHWIDGGTAQIGPMAEQNTQKRYNKEFE